METNFNFKSSPCTSREQSKRLLALGLKKETADMHLQSTLNDVWSPYIPIVMPYSKVEAFNLSKDVFRTIPAWSLGRLLEMMPMSLIEDMVYHERWDLNITPIMVLYRNQDQPDEWIGECLGQGMYNNVIDCIEWLIKEGYFNKEYLV